MLPSTFGPPSRAATSTARRSFAKTRPRFSSLAPFFRFMELHFECPDMALLLGGFAGPSLARQREEALVEPGVACHLGVERRRQQAALLDRHRRARVPGEHLNARAHPSDPWGPDEDRPDRADSPDVDLSLERVNLPPIGVALNPDVK